MRKAPCCKWPLSDPSQSPPQGTALPLHQRMHMALLYLPLKGILSCWFKLLANAPSQTDDDFALGRSPNSARNNHQMRVSAIHLPPCPATNQTSPISPSALNTPAVFGVFDALQAEVLIKLKVHLRLCPIHIQINSILCVTGRSVIQQLRREFGSSSVQKGSWCP